MRIALWRGPILSCLLLIQRMKDERKTEQLREERSAVEEEVEEAFLPLHVAYSTSSADKSNGSDKRERETCSKAKQGYAQESCIAF